MGVAIGIAALILSVIAWVNDAKSVATWVTRSVLKKLQILTAVKPRRL